MNEKVRWSLFKAVSEAGVRPPLYWFHDKGYFEEFLGHKTDLNKIPGQIYQEDVLLQNAKNLADMHKVDVPNINQVKDGPNLSIWSSIF